MAVADSTDSVPASVMLAHERHAGFVRVTMHAPGEDRNGEVTWIAVRHILRLWERHEYKNPNARFTRVMFADGGHNNYQFLDVQEPPYALMAAMACVD